MHKIEVWLRLFWWFYELFSTRFWFCLRRSLKSPVLVSFDRKWALGVCQCLGFCFHSSSGRHVVQFTVWQLSLFSTHFFHGVLTGLVACLGWRQDKSCLLEKFKRVRGVLMKQKTRGVLKGQEAWRCLSPKDTRCQFKIPEPWPGHPVQHQSRRATEQLLLHSEGLDKKEIFGSRYLFFDRKILSGDCKKWLRLLSISNWTHKSFKYNVILVSYSSSINLGTVKQHTYNLNIIFVMN